MYQGTRITEPPAMSGRAGQAWPCNLPAPGQRGRPEFDGTVNMYIVRAPGAHPLWNHWVVSVIHLRPIEGVKPATVRVPGATHEFMVVALDPGEPLPGLDAGPNWRPHFLRPTDVIEQFQSADDVVADRILTMAIQAIVDGIASPDQDWRGWWSDAIKTTAAHFSDGTHHVRRPS